MGRRERCLLYKRGECPCSGFGSSDKRWSVQGFVSLLVRGLSEAGVGGEGGDGRPLQTSGKERRKERGGESRRMGKSGQRR